MTSLPVISCTDQPCGACCMEMGLLPLICYVVVGMDDNPALLPEELQQDLRDAHGGKYKGGDDQPCMWLDLETRRCKHYEHRPSVCRGDLVVPGNDACLHWRENMGVPCRS